MSYCPENDVIAPASDEHVVSAQGTAPRLWDQMDTQPLEQRQTVVAVLILLVNDCPWGGRNMGAGSTDGGMDNSEAPRFVLVPSCPSPVPRDVKAE